MGSHLNFLLNEPAFGLFAVLLLIAALVYGSTPAGRPPGSDLRDRQPPTSFVETRLEPEIRSRLGMDGIRRIVEWEVFYLQGLAQEEPSCPGRNDRRRHGPAVAFIQGRKSLDLMIATTRLATLRRFGTVAGYLESIEQSAIKQEEQASDGSVRVLPQPIRRARSGRFTCPVCGSVNMVRLRRCSAGSAEPPQLGTRLPPRPRIPPNLGSRARNVNSRSSWATWTPPMPELRSGVIDRPGE